MLLGLLLISALSWRRERVAARHALIITGLNRRRVERKATWVARWFHHVDLIDLTTQTVEIVRTGNRAFTCKDGKRIEVRATALVEIGPGSDDIMRVAQYVGCAGAADGTTIKALVEPKLAGGIAAVAAMFTASEAMQRLDELAHEALQCIGQDLNGMYIAELTVSPLENRVAPVSMGPFR